MADTKDNKLTLVSEFLLHLTNWERIGMHPGYIFPRIKHWFFNKNEFEFEFGKHKQTREKSRKYNLKIFALCFPSSALYSFPSKLYEQASHSAHFPNISLLSLLAGRVLALFRFLSRTVSSFLPRVLMMTCFGSTVLFASSKFNRRVICQYVHESLSHQCKLINM